MNDRIKDLALECIVQNVASPAWVFTTEELEKFGDMIIQDCIKEIEKNFVGSVHSHSVTWNTAVKKCADKVKAKYYE